MIEAGKTVQVHYKGTLGDGTVFDSSEGRDPIAFEVGSGQVIPGFEAAVVGMAVGDSQTVNIPCAEAYGEPREEMIGQYTHEVECWRGGGERVLFVERLKQQGKVEGFHTQMRRKDGGWRGDLLDSCFALLFLNRASVTRGY